MSEKRLYIVNLLYKLPPSDRTVYRAHADAEDFVDMHASENRELDEPAVYAQWLDDEGVEAFRQASNFAKIEEAQRTHKIGPDIDTPDPSDPAEAFPEYAAADASVAEEVARLGVEHAVLDFHNFDEARGPQGEGVIVGVGDTGYREWAYTGPRFIEAWDFSDSGHPDDMDGHGSWCQGAAVPVNGRFVSGKVLGDDGSGWNAWTMAFIRRFTDYCQERELPGVISLSLGGGGYSSAYEDAARYATERGVIIVAAAGNESQRDHISSPANCPSILSVGAMSHHDGSIASFSNRATAPPEPDIYAAGVRVAGQGEGLWSGTSMATPLVARAAARAMGLNGATVGSVKFYLVASAREKATYEGHGLLAVRGLLRKLGRLG